VRGSCIFATPPHLHHPTDAVGDRPVLEPSYLRMDRPQLNHRIEQAWELMHSPCRVCPRGCKVDRTQDDHRGYCGVGAKALIAGSAVFFAEDPPLLGPPPTDGRLGGSGTIIFASCNLSCIYCIAWRYSQERQGSSGDGSVAPAREVSPEYLASMMLRLQQLGCVNIHLYTPSLCGPQILAALPYAIDAGLTLPLVYDTSCYDSVEMLRLFDGIVDIYVPDIRFTDDEMSAQYAGARDYWDVAKEALKEMHRQVGDLVVVDGLAVRGLVIRHLVLPEGIAGTPEAMRFVAEELSPNSYVNLMWQYRPDWRAWSSPELGRRINGQEFIQAVIAARDAGLWRLPGAVERLEWISGNPVRLMFPLPAYPILDGAAGRLLSEWNNEAYAELEAACIDTAGCGEKDTPQEG